jgi:hypothetical protein
MVIFSSFATILYYLHNRAKKPEAYIFGLFLDPLTPFAHLVSQALAVLG